MQVEFDEAKTQLPKLIAAAERGEEVIIARRDKPVVRIVVEKRKSNRRVLGFLASHEVQIDGFFDPVLDAQIAKDFLRFAAADTQHPVYLTHDDRDQGA